MSSSPVPKARRPGAVVLIGVSGEAQWNLAPEAASALERAPVVAGAPRLLDAYAAAVAGARAPGRPAARLERMEGPLGVQLGRIEEILASGDSGPLCILASGDPGFFGLLRPLRARLGAVPIEVHPAPSSVSLAFARLGIPWDVAAVVSAHGRDADAAALAASAVLGKQEGGLVALLCSAENHPAKMAGLLCERLGAAAQLAEAACCQRLASEAEEIVRAPLVELASAGGLDPLCVLVVASGRLEEAIAKAPALARPASCPPPPTAPAAEGWALEEGQFSHRDGMITKAEVRALVLARLALPERGVLWDIGAGSGSVAIEAARLRPNLCVIAIERDAAAAARIESNARAHGVALRVVHGEAPGVLGGLDAPDRCFVGGGGIAVLQAALAALSPGGRAVAAYASMERAAAAASLLGSMTQLGVARGRRLADGSWRLEASNPVFVAWGS